MAPRLRLALTVAIILLVGCASMAAPIAAKPGRPTLLQPPQAPAQLQWTVPVSSAVLASYVPGQKISTDGGATYAAPQNLNCTGTTVMTCTATFPPTAKGTYQTRVEICDSQGTKTKCSEGPIASIDFLPAPASPSAPACPTGCTDSAPLSIVLAPIAGPVSTATPITMTTTGAAASVRLEVLTLTDGSVVCECAVFGGPTVWTATLHAENGQVGGQYALRPSVTDANGHTVVGPNVPVTIGLGVMLSAFSGHHR